MAITWKNRLAGAALVLGLGMGLSAAQAQGQRYGFGPMMGGPGAAYGGGPGMMYGAGPGMMYGGPGMMYGDPDDLDCPYGGWGSGYQRDAPVPGWGRGPGGSFNLTDEQRKKLQTLNEHVWKQRQEMAQKMLEQRTRLQQLQLGDDPDPEAIIKAERAMSELRLQLREAELRAQRDFEQSLNAEQRNQWRQMQQPWGGRPW